MIIKTKKGWVVYSEDKVRKAGPFPTRKEAETVSSRPRSTLEEGGPYGGRHDPA